MRPAKSILNPAFAYRPSHATDIRETFERVRAELERSRAARQDAEAGRVVLPLKKTG